jgi:hypothetical protein
MNPLITSAILSVLRYAITWAGGAVILSSHGDQVEILAGVIATVAPTVFSLIKNKRDHDIKEALRLAAESKSNL